MKMSHPIHLHENYNQYKCSFCFPLPVTLVPSCVTDNEISIRRTLTIGVRDDHTQDLKDFKKSLSVSYWDSNKKQSKF